MQYLLGVCKACRQSAPAVMQALVQDAVLKWKKGFSAGTDVERRDESEQHVFSETESRPSKVASENVHLLASQPLFSDYVPARDDNPGSFSGRSAGHDRHHAVT